MVRPTTATVPVAPTSILHRASSVPVLAIAVAIAAFALYRATLLPGFDFGDTGFLQVKAGEIDLTPRDAYPLYFGIGDIVLWLTRDEPAHAFNLTSAIEGAVACGLIALVGAELAGALAAGVVAALLFASSYTFWSQAIAAEVYALHIALVAASLLLILRWADHPTHRRLAMFFACYALGFGNHLSMVLLAPGFALFLLIAAPHGWRSMLRPRVIALAAAIAAAGSLQYLWNLRGLWASVDPPRTLPAALLTFWFDVTKSDWRETLVLGVPTSLFGDRCVMYAFDVFQQFGWAVLLAPLGLVRLLATNWRTAALMVVLYATNLAFAFSYNVGDAHVFYLPSHVMLALMMAPGVVALGALGAAASATVRAARPHRTPRTETSGSHAQGDAATRRRLPAIAVVSGLALAFAMNRVYRDYPALDRSADRRPTQVMSALTTGVDDQHAILIADLNWQLVNGLAYFAKAVRPDVPYAWARDVMLYAPALVRDNLAAGRQVVVTSRARDEIARAYGPLLPSAIDPLTRVSTLREMAADLPHGTRYVLCALSHSLEFPVDADDVAGAVQVLTGGRSGLPSGDYAALAGLVGEPPELSYASARPFRRAVEIGNVPIEIRMESWLTFDTIRRMGFGQVVAGRRHTLIVERGISFATFDDRGGPLKTVYAGNIFAPQPRYLIQRLKDE